MAIAYAALVSLMNVIHDLQHHPSPPISLHDLLLDPINQHILDFLQDYSADNDQESADPLEMRIANAAYKAEDAIESHIVNTIQPPSSNSRSNSTGSKITQIFSCFQVPPKEPINANGEMIKSINLCHVRLQMLIHAMDCFKNLVVDTEEKKKMVVVHDQVLLKNVLASVSREEAMVGLDVALREIMEKLTGGESDLQVTPIVGMGGIGKTFLAKSIYAEPFIKGHFDIIAWATISQQYKTTEILSEILFQATKEKNEVLSGDELGLKLRKFLFGRRFLIVLDDMWNVDAWDKIQRFFPNNENGSRVMVTTRLSHLSSQLNHDYSLHMSFLDKTTSWDLFSKTVFGYERSCPPELKEIGEQIVDNCRGLPLSIVVVGGLLKKSDGTLASWKSIRDNMSSMVNMENDNHCLKLLKMSYNHLPIYLKPCFLYMGVFKEDDEIRVSVLIKLWVSEGFLKPSNDEAMKTTARVFLHDLIDRNLIQIHSLGCTGNIKYCKIHDLVRDLCLKEGKKDGLYHVIGKCNLEMNNTIRRVVIPMNTSKENGRDDQLRYMSNARSVICEYGYGDVLTPNLGLLRTIHACRMYDKKINSDCNLNTLLSPHFNLRHLAIRFKDGDMMSSFLQSVSLLWNLHTLIISCWQEITLPSDFWKMSQFRHIEFGYIRDKATLHLPNIPSDEGDGDLIIMENLHTLKGVLNLKCCQGMVKRIPNLKKLKLKYNDTGNEQGENIKSLCRLESLQIYNYSKFDIIQKPSFPQSLKKLCLRMRKEFEWDDYVLEKIGLLPHLEKLRLLFGCFRKGKLETVEGQFPCLKYLELKSCAGLENWTAEEEGSSILPRLERLSLSYIDSLNEIPLELGNIDTLKKIDLFWCGDETLVNCAKQIVDEQVESQGQLSFHFCVVVKKEDALQCVKGLADPPNFEVMLL